MNASLHRDDRRRDRIFKKFTVESNLKLPTNYPIDFTFHHHNGKGKSQIDYILFKGKTLNLQPSVSIMPFDAINTSDHTLIKVEITTQIPLPTDLSVFRRLYFGIDFLPALCNVFSSVAILSATLSFIVFFLLSYFCLYDFLIFVRIAFVPCWLGIYFS
jgi:hypothetical protein